MTTIFPPHRLLFGRNPGTKIPEVVQQPKHQDDKAVRAEDSQAKGKMKEYADERANAKYSPVCVGDIVIVRQQRLNKLDPKYDPQPLTVEGRNGPMVTAKRPDGSKVTRNISLFHPVRTQDTKGQQNGYEMDFEYGTTDLTEAQIPPQIAPVPPVLEPAAIAAPPIVDQPPVSPRRSGRIRRQPERLIEKC